MYPTVLAVLFFAVLVACAAPPAIEPPAFSQRPASFEGGPITLSPPVVMVGDSVTISTTFKNTDAIAGTYAVALLVNGQQSGSQDISLNPGSSQEVTFQLSETTAGDYYLSIGSSNAVLTVYNWRPYTIQYDGADGSPVGAYVNGEQGHIVHFTPPNKAFRVQKIRIFGATMIKNTSELDNHITVRIWNKDGTNQLWSQDFTWRLFLSGSWQEIKVPDIRVEDDFEVEAVTHSIAQGDPIDFALIAGIAAPPGNTGGKLLHFPGPASYAQSVVLIGAVYPPSYLEFPSPSNRPETRSGYSYMGKLIDPGQGRLERINWLIRVDGEGASGN